MGVAFLSFFSGGVARHAQRGRAKEGGRAEVERVFAHGGKGVGKEKGRKFKTKVGK